MQTNGSAARDISLDDKYLREEGPVYLTGIQALVRLTLDQHRADLRRGLRTATFVSGYRGSPLGGVDQAFERASTIARQHDVVFSNGLNEELAATAVFGSQLSCSLPGARYDGVLGMWYGKGPGVDRSGDIFKHANLAGVGKHGGVLALAGDDPLCKSSTIPSHSEPAFFDANFPTLYPGSVQELLDFGLHGYALSRYAGLWVGMKCVTDVCDQAGTVEVSPSAVVPVTPELEIAGRPFRPSFDARLIAPYSLEMEATLLSARLLAARSYAAANDLNRIVARGEGDRIGIVAAGKTWYDLRQALRDLGLNGDALRRAGIRLLKLGMLYPLEPGIVREFASGLREIVVLEEKRSFVELLLRDALYNLAERPQVVGKLDESDAPLVPAHGELDPDAIARILARRLAAHPMPASVKARIARLDEIQARPAPLTLVRTPFFCSGCPHNTSTVVPEGSIAGGGIGCHAMALRMDRATGITPMGGEGAQWIGMSPFTETRHIFQNIGDGTLFHSGMLAVKAAVAAGVNITYKVLYNSAVAMTGGQQAAGALPVPALARQLEAEGAKAVAIVSDAPEVYDNVAVGFATVHHRDELEAVQKRLREIPGATFLIYDQECAAEKRRLRKRGKRPDPPQRVFIDEAVCEGCGDCGVQSNCLSVQPVETELGRKTRIHQSSCNKDYSCLKGDCPSFLTAVPRSEEAPVKVPRRVAPALEASSLPEPARKPACGDGYAICLMGIGGTGVVTVNSILGTAALVEGKHVRSLDQTGLSQKGGPVVSHLKLFDAPPDRASRLVAGEADLYLGLDLLVSTSSQNLARTHPDRTVAVVSTSKVPTGEMVAHVNAAFPDPGSLCRTIDRTTRSASNLYLDSVALAEGLFGDHMPAGLFLLGVAWQAGLLPLQADSIERSIALNGVSVESNRQAFRWGRRWVIEGAAVEEAARADATVTALAPAPARASGLSLRDREALAQLAAAPELSAETRRLVGIRAPELAAYQDAAYARTYLEFVAQVARAEGQLTPGRTGIAEACARNLFKLMAYKDEYEVARLLLLGGASEAIRRRFPGGAKIYYHLHPPILRALGMKKKLRLGSWFRPALGLLRSLRRLRGTPFDPFGRAEVRKLERALVGEYRTLLLRTIATLSPKTCHLAVQLAGLPDMVRGYESIKLRNAAGFRARAVELQAQLDALSTLGGDVHRTAAV